MNFIDLFAGAGGLSEGFIRAGFKLVAHVEMDKAACHTLQTRVAYYHLKNTGEEEIYYKYLRGEINREKLYSHIPDSEITSVINLPIGQETNADIQQRIDTRLNNQPVDLIIGGPPCQAYSIAGRSRSKNKMEGDPRNFLYLEYLKYLEKYNPRLFVFENVLGLKSAKGGFYLQNMEQLFLEKGYKMKLFTLEANKFSVLQNRKRIIIIGWRADLDFTPPDLESINTSLKIYTVADLLNDLPAIQDGGGADKNMKYAQLATEYLDNSHIRNGIEILTQHIARPHSERDKQIYKVAVEKWEKGERLNYNDLSEELKTHNNRETFTDRFKVVAANLPYSQTIVAHIAKDGHYYIHPDKNQNRSISVREAARLQSFPDNYYFEGVKENANRTAAFKQIGNAVPPLMAYEIAKKIKELL